MAFAPLYFFMTKPYWDKVCGNSFSRSVLLTCEEFPWYTAIIYG